uniref:DUF4283 domain-containing protein n=1 Tax=Salix viminalis TaxID=40686 RepID=A0A6N2LUH8_SALVM
MRTTIRLEKVTTMNNNFIMFRLSNESSIEDIMAKSPWLFGGKTMILLKWYLGFYFDKNRISSLLVWVWLKGLPFTLCNKQGLSMAASMAEKPIDYNEHTFEL